MNIQYFIWYNQEVNEKYIQTLENKKDKEIFKKEIDEFIHDKLVVANFQLGDDYYGNTMVIHNDTNKGNFFETHIHFEKQEQIIKDFNNLLNAENGNFLNYSDLHLFVIKQENNDSCFGFEENEMVYKLISHCHWGTFFKMSSSIFLNEEDFKDLTNTVTLFHETIKKAEELNYLH
jgi:hypothetical protein